MKRLLAAMLCLLLGLAGATAAELRTMPLHEEPQPVPDITFLDDAGASLTLDAWRGRIVLLNVCATWCVSCRAEMPTLDRLQAQLGGERFEVVALSVDRAGVGAVRRFFDEIGIRALRIFVDRSGKAARDLRIFGIPATLLIGPDGREMGRLVGPAEWDAPEMVAFFRTIIANSQGGN